MRPLAASHRPHIMRRPSRLTSRTLTRSLALTLFAASASLVLVTDATDACAQPAPRPSRITPPGKSLAGTDDSDAMALNPAQLAYLPSWEMRYLHVQLPKEATTLQPGRGDAFGLAFPLFAGFATGFRFEWNRPPEKAPLPSSSSFSWSLAAKLSDALSIAIDVRRWYSDDLAALDGATSLSLGFALRPSRYLGLAFVSRDINSPRGQTFGPAEGISRSYDYGLAIRPLGTRTFELGLEATSWGRSFAGEAKWSPRITLGADIPRIGRLMLSGQLLDPTSNATSKESWILTAGIELAASGSRLNGGVIGGKGLSPGNSGAGAGWYVGAAIAGWEEPNAVRLPERAVTIRLEETPGSRGHVRLLRKLARLGRDPTVRAVAIIAKTDPASSTAHAEELNHALSDLQAKGIKVLCHFEDASGKALLACASADKILLTPAGGVRFAGLRAQTMYFGGALQKLGIDPEFIRVKEHKSAAESFVREGPTPIAAADQREYLAAIEQVYLTHLAKGRHLTPTQVKLAIEKGPFIADEAIAAGFVDAKAFDDEINRHIREVVGDFVRVEEDEQPTVAPKSFGPKGRIAIVYIDGDIVDGRSQTIPILGEKMSGSYTVAEALKEAREDSSIEGVVLRIESPGGSSLASDVMWREAELLQKSGKPVVVSMGSVAASGGYYTAAFGAPIYANQATVTGSIGIFYGKVDTSGLLDKLGIHVVTQKTAPKADAESLYRPFTPQEIEELTVKVGQFYAVFLDRVSRGRHMSIEEVDKVGRGKVWLGLAAKEHGLVDVIGGIDDALAAVRKQAGLPADAPITELPVEKGGLIDLVLGAMGAEAPPSVAKLPKMLLAYAHALAPFLVYAPDEAVAMWEGLEAP